MADMVEGIDPLTTGETMHDKEIDETRGSARYRRRLRLERNTGQVETSSFQAAPINRKVSKNASKEAQAKVAKGRKEK